MNIRYPNITNASPTEQLMQIKSYLYQLVEQLNMETQNTVPEEQQIDASTKSAIAKTSILPDKSSSGQNATPISTFNQIKSLIIKSADIVNAYYTEINKRLEKEYVAESEFGTYRNEADQYIKANADNIEQIFGSLQEIEAQQKETIDTKAFIKSGKLFTVGDETLESELGQPLDPGTEVYGVEIRQVTIINEAEVFNKFARFTSYGMTLYDKNGELTAYITDRKMNIPNTVIKNSLTCGGFQEIINSDGSSVERWVGV